MKFDIYKAGKFVGSVFSEAALAAAKAAGLSNAKESNGVAFEWFLDGDHSYSVEVIEA